MRHIIILTYLFLFTAATICGRDPIVGLVTDDDEGLPLGGVSARIVDSKGKIKKFTASNADGLFTITAPDGDSLTLQLAKMSYLTMTYSLDTLSTADTLRVTMPVNAVRLAEVGVRAKRIRENGDTVTYTVNQFTRKQDRSIGEVMNRMPGLEVSEAGGVKYQGTDINRLYVDGTDMAGSNHGLITKNIQATDVRAVEVLENHQPMQVLRGLSFSDQAAVNLKLKESAATRLTAHGDIGTGYSERGGALYLGKLFTMTLRGSVKNITELSLNNTGNPLAGSSGSGATGETLTDYISIGSVGGSGNSIFNRSASISTNTTWKSRQNGNWRLQAAYGYDHLWADRATVTTYYLPDGDRVITENRHADSRDHTAGLIANYELNQKTYYLNNNFSFNSLWEDTHIDITGTLANSQHASTPSYNIANNLKIIKRFSDRHIVTFNSTNQWLYKPHNLLVELSDGNDISRAASHGSNVRQNAFFTDERASYGFIIGRVIATVEGGVAAFIRHLDSDIDGDITLPGIESSNDFSTNYLRLFAKPKFELNLRRVNINLNIPLNYYSYFFGRALRDRNELFIAPSLTAQWKPNRRHTFNFEASARRSPASLGNILRGDILSDYRTFNAGIDDYYASTGQRVRVRWEWRNSLRGYFFNASVTQSWNSNKYGTAQTLVGDYVINSYRAEPSRSESTGVNASYSQSIDAINSSLTLRGAYNRATSTVFSQGDPVRRSTTQYLATGHFDVRLCSWANADYDLSYISNTLSLQAMPSSRIDSYTNTVTVNFTPGKWIINLNGSWQCDRLEPHRYENRVNLGTYLRYNLSKKLDLSLSANNLLDKRTWINRSFTELASIETISYQRGRQFLLTLRIIK